MDHRPTIQEDQHLHRETNKHIVHKFSHAETTTSTEHNQSHLVVARTSSLSVMPVNLSRSKHECCRHDASQTTSHSIAVLGCTQRWLVSANHAK